MDWYCNYSNTYLWALSKLNNLWLKSINPPGWNLEYNYNHYYKGECFVIAETNNQIERVNNLRWKTDDIFPIDVQIKVKTVVNQVDNSLNAGSLENTSSIPLDKGITSLTFRINLPSNENVNTDRYQFNYSISDAWDVFYVIFY